jgi:hypothetical protein
LQFLRILIEVTLNLANLEAEDIVTVGNFAREIVPVNLVKISNLPKGDVAPIPILLLEDAP